jgi:PAS domain S-box-containing protein
MTTAASAPSLLERIGTQPFDDLAALAIEICSAQAAAVRIELDEEPATFVTPPHPSFDAPLRNAVVAALIAASGVTHAEASSPTGVTTLAIALETSAGERVGALAVAFSGPRQLTDVVLRSLHRLGRYAAALVEQAVLSGDRARSDATRQRMHLAFDAEDERKAALATAVHALPDIVAIADRHGVVRYLNPAGRRLVPESATGKATLRDLHAPDQRLTYDLAATRAAQHGTWTGETTLLGPNGVRIMATTTLVVLRGRAAEPDGLALVARDVSESSKELALLRQSEGRFRHLVEDVDDVLFEQNSDGRWTFLNPSWTDVTGFTVEESLGRLYEEFMHPDDAAASKARRAGLLKSGNHDGVHASRYATKDGSWRWLEARVRRNLGPSGEALGTVGTLRDVTIRREMAAEMDEARDQAVRTTTLMSEFLATMSHEIRTPLNGVLGLMTILQDTPLDDEQRGIASSAQRSAEALLTLVNDILDISKLEADKITIESVPFGLREWVNEVISPSMARARAKGLTVELTVEPRLPSRVVGDPTRCRQILTNLLDNAVKFTDQGTIRVALTAATSAEGRPMVRVAVTDSGIGIPAEKQALVFEKYRQADNSTSRRYGGTGLGLAICRQLAQRMDGAVGVESAAGKGSTFWFTVPLVTATPDEEAEPPAAAPSPPAVEPAPSAVAPVVLLVEDNPTNQFVARKLLEKAGCRVDIVNNGAEAVERLRATAYQVVFMDCQMPVMDGYEATRRIRQMDGPVASVPIVAMTAHAMAGDRERCLDAGMSDYVSKPLRPAVLNAALLRALGLAVETADA